MAGRIPRFRHLVAAMLAIAIDFWLAIPVSGADYSVRAIVALASWVVLLRLVPLASTSDYPSWGNVRESLRWTVRISSIVLGVLGVLVAGAIFALGFDSAVVSHHPFTLPADESVFEYAASGLLAAPLVEEFIYRGVVHPRLEGALGPRLAIFVGGFIFWGLHWVYFQGMSPINHLVAGWILGFAFWKTRSLLAPTVLHFLGNLMLVLADLWIRNSWIPSNP